MEHPQRKPNRLKEYDYSTPGAYFITICTKNRENIFWENVGASIARPEDIVLTAQGCVADRAIKNIPKHYSNITVDHYVVMPNHIHLLLQIHTDHDGACIHMPSISIVVQQMKGYITKQLGYSVWQKLYHDHVVRGEKDYRKIWEYIENNPVKWTEDCFYNPNAY